jgi:hypothetical protein
VGRVKIAELPNLYVNTIVKNDYYFFTPLSNIRNSTNAISNAKAFKIENPTERQATGARIYHANESSVRTSCWRDSQRVGKPPIQHGGQNKILSEAQIQAVSTYVRDMYLSRLGATKQIVYTAISYLQEV